MTEGEVRVINDLGLHARAAAQLVKTAERFSSRIRLEREDSRIEADAKSILSVLSLAASKGVVLRLSADGPDEMEAFKAVSDLFESGFGEK